MNTKRLFAAVLLSGSIGAVESNAGQSEIREEEYRFGEKVFRSAVVIPPIDRPLPGIFMVPNWMGVSANTLGKAARVAEMGFVVYVADVYSADVRPANPREAGEAAAALRSDRTLMRQRGRAALDHFRDWSTRLPVQQDAIAAIGFCFGGGMILEMARDGVDLPAFVAFHGDLDSPTLAGDSAQIRGKVLVLHGADDPSVPVEHVNRFTEAMRQTEVDWQLIVFSGAVHSFTNPHANNPGRSQYHPLVAERAFAYMRTFFAEVFGTAAGE
jgi:dienelactone hydrolase